MPVSSPLTNTIRALFIATSVTALSCGTLEAPDIPLRREGEQLFDFLESKTERLRSSNKAQPRPR